MNTPDFGGGNMNANSAEYRTSEARNRSIVMLDLGEVCATLRISRAALYVHEAAGLIKFTKIGRRTLISEAELERFIAAANEGAAA
jgi:excisionase family DNA binding protein